MSRVQEQRALETQGASKLWMSKPSNYEFPWVGESQDKESRDHQKPEQLRETVSVKEWEKDTAKEP